MKSRHLTPDHYQHQRAETAAKQAIKAQQWEQRDRREIAPINHLHRRDIEDHRMARELGISLDELRGGARS